MTTRRRYFECKSLAIVPALILAFAPGAVSACNVAHCSLHRAGTMAAAESAASKTLAMSPTATAASHIANEVVIRGFAFQPATLTVAAGSKVVWTNRDEEPHIVVSAGGQFPPSPALDTDDSFAAVFAKPGTYVYFCSIHPHMVGTIVVK